MAWSTRSSQPIWEKLGYWILSKKGFFHHKRETIFSGIVISNYVKFTSYCRISNRKYGFIETRKLCVFASNLYFKKKIIFFKKCVSCKERNFNIITQSPSSRLTAACLGQILPFFLNFQLTLRFLTFKSEFRILLFKINCTPQISSAVLDFLFCGQNFIIIYAM